MTEIVGILNLTPDSFSDGGKYNSYDAAIQRAEKLFAEGATIVDVGAESTRPNAEQLSAEEEWDRLDIILPELIKKYPGRISLDSYHPENIEKALNIGPVIVNDVTGMTNPAMIDVVLKYKPIYIVSQIPNADIQVVHKGELIDDVNVVRDDLLRKKQILVDGGMPPEGIILDPGIGFGKTMELNAELLEFAKLMPSEKVMIGYSRKRFLGENRMEIEPNLQAGRKAIASGAAYIRVHDVAPHLRLINGLIH